MKSITLGIALTVAILITDLASNTAHAAASTFCHRVVQTPMSAGGPNPAPNIGCEVDWIGTPAGPINLLWLTAWECFSSPTFCVGVETPDDYEVSSSNITFSGEIKKYPGNCVESLWAGQAAQLVWEPADESAGPFGSGDQTMGPVGLSSFCDPGGPPPN